MLDEITYPFTNFNEAAVDVWKLINNTLNWTLEYLSRLEIKLTLVDKRPIRYRTIHPCLSDFRIPRKTHRTLHIWWRFSVISILQFKFSRNISTLQMKLLTVIFLRGVLKTALLCGVRFYSTGSLKEFKILILVWYSLDFNTRMFVIYM